MTEQTIQIIKLMAICWVLCGLIGYWALVRRRVVTFNFRNHLWACLFGPIVIFVAIGDQDQ